LEFLTLGSKLKGTRRRFGGPEQDGRERLAVKSRNFDNIGTSIVIARRLSLRYLADPDKSNAPDYRSRSNSIRHPDIHLVENPIPRSPAEPQHLSHLPANGHLGWNHTSGVRPVQ
jgi:hypothetical protein